MEFSIKETLKKIFAKGAAKTIELMLLGGFVYYFGNVVIKSHDKTIINEVVKVINKGDSITQAKIKEVGENNNYNTVLTIERISSLEDTIYHDNKALRKENQKLQNERFKLQLEKSSLLLFEKKKFNPIPFCLIPQSTNNDIAL
jgi:hypothetical protein